MIVIDSWAAGNLVAAVVVAIQLVAVATGVIAAGAATYSDYFLALKNHLGKAVAARAAAAAVGCFLEAVEDIEDFVLVDC